MSAFFGVAVFKPKAEVNIGTLWRTSQILGAAFLATIGRRYRRQPSDTMKAWKSIPLFNFETFEDFERTLPLETLIVGVELTEEARLLDSFTHPKRAVYLLGAEDHGIPEGIQNRCHQLVRLRGERSMNVSVAGSILLYHRTLERP